MRKLISILDRSFPIVNPGTGVTEEAFNVWVKQVTSSGIFIGDGSPEGLVEAQQGSFYMDESGSAGSILYIKQQASVTKDRTKGWVAIG